ncbi:hypothetical protein ZWY2020_024408 [Hordeum vulgare]|nr:hypothetical protein ZWY2020_024408 [Hordeum vulgare]
MPSHPKGWGESWFYCQETSPAGENKLLGYRPTRLPINFKLLDKLTEEEESEFIPILSELRSLTNNGLTGVDLIRCWVEWRILPLSRRDGLMCEFDGTLDHPQCYFHTALTEKDIVAIIKKLTGEPAGKCGQIGLKPFCKINPAPKKGDKFWSRRPKKQAMKTAKPPSKKTKGKGKSAAAEPYEVDESQVGDVLSENSPPTSGDSVMSTLPPMIRVPGAQAKKRKTSGSIPDATSEPPKESTPTQDDPGHAEPTIQVDLPESSKETTDASKSPNPLMTTEDPDAVVITGSGFSKPAATVLSKHVASSSQAIPESGLSKAKLSDYANLEFKELCSGFASPRVANLQEDRVLMLKAIYTLTEQLYTGSVLTVKVVMGAKEPITSIKKVLGCLSTLPPQIGELTRSAARKGVLTALSRCLAYAPEINLEEVAAGFPQLKDDGSEFVEEDYQKVVKDSRLAATRLAARLDLTYQ